MFKKINWIALLVITAGMISSCGNAEKNDGVTEGNTEEAAVINTTHAYICPMHCENSASMEPGACNSCGMDLVKNPDYKGEVTEAVEVVESDSTSNMMMDGEGEEDHEGHNH